jgi:glutamate 5-kinase
MKTQSNSQIIVVKIEISTLMEDHGELSMTKMERLAMILSNFQNSGKKIIIVSSGAIALGSKKLKLAKLPESFNDKQATAAIGQAELIKTYQNVFGEFNQIVAQVLLTKDVVEKKVRKDNATNTLHHLMSMNIIPIVNENDAISTDDIILEDNYPLALNVARLVDAKMIIIKFDNNGKFLIFMRGNNQVIRTSYSMIDDQLEILFNSENWDISVEDFPETYNQENYK